MENLKSILITGASSGIGKACALYLAKHNYRVFAGVRKPKDGEALRQEAGEMIKPVILDITNEEHIGCAADQIASEINETGLVGLVNNAGISTGGPIEFLPMEEIRRIFDVNFFGHILVTQTFLPMLRKAKGRIVNISSVSGRVAYPFMAPYTTSKFALEAFSDVLRRELLPWDMHVAVIQPGGVATPIWDKTLRKNIDMFQNNSREMQDLYGPQFEAVKDRALRLGKTGLAPEIIAKKVFHALTSSRPKTRYLITKNPPPMIGGLLRYIPDKFIDQVLKRTLRR